ncbi:UNVERIFIED_CONTAM: Transposon Tf2-12 polyprotein [Sesamum indicum]
MGPRRTATAAKASGQDPESPRHAAASSSERAENPEDGHSRLVELETKVSSLESEITVLNSELDECRQVIQEMAGVFGNDSIADMRRDMEQMSIQIGLLQRAVGSTPMVAHDPGARLRIPEPKAYSGERDAKEVENFLFDMEQYFLVADMRDEARKVATATMYLTGDAKLWWRTKFAEIQAHQIQLDTWALLREAIREQFFPENVEYNARRALRKLEHTGSVREYVKAFSALMLNIRDMSEADKLFTFMEGLKQWARNELQRQRVTDLSSAIIAAERLADFNQETRKDRQATSGPAQNKSNGMKSFRNIFNRGGGDQRPHAQNGSQGGSDRNRPQENRQGAPERRRGCFFCDGPHGYRDCPKRRVLNALATTFADNASSSRSVEPQAEAGGENGTEEDEDNLGAVSQWCNTVSMVAAKRVVPPLAKKTVPALTVEQPEQKEEEVQPRIPRKKGLMFVDVKIHGKPIRAMIDTGASHNYLASAEVARLGLVLEKGVGRVKAINSAAQPIAGVAKSVQIKVGAYEGKTNLSVVVMDDFKLILGLEFLRDTRTAVLPHVDSLMMMGAKPCVIPTLAGRTGERNLSAMQFEKGRKRNEPSYLCTLCLDEMEEVSGPIPSGIKKLLMEFEDVMPDELPRKLPPKRAVDHEIELVPSTRPPARAPYRMSQPELVELRKQLKDMLESGIIKPAKSPYGAPVLFQKKADGSLRLCCDYRALNKIIVKNKYPIPLVADCFDRLSGANYFTKIDLRSGYWQVRVKEGDEAKTTVVTRYGAFEFLVMPFGLTNAPATFSTLMNQVLHGFLDEFVVVYLDDIVIYSRTLAEHEDHLRQVLTRLREHELYVKVSKCSFARETISFLGHIVERGRIRMDPKKVQAIEEWRPPSDVHDLRSFLGLANYYRRFVKDYSAIARPLTDLLKKTETWNWTPQCQVAFDDLKRAMMTDPVLALPDMSKPFLVETDASDFALGGVLMQDGHPVAFESRKLKDAERRYSVHEKELLAVVHCVRLWRHYLLGSPFVVRTDNTAVSHFMSQPKLTSRQARWQELLSEFHFVLEYRAGSSNHAADALSRRADLANLESIAALSSSVAAISVKDQVRELLPRDPAAQGLIRLVEQGKARHFWIEDGLLMTKGNRVYIPRGGDLRKSLLSECHDTLWAGHQGQERTFALVKRAYYWPQLWDDVETYVRTCLICQQDKAGHQKKAGLLQPLPIPKRPWESVSMDYISGLPKVGDLGSIIVVVDRLSKYATFIAAPKHVTAEGTAHLFFKHIVKHWGLPKDIVSDRDSRFTGVFWTELFKLLGSTLSMSSSYHPQSDGQTERFNSMLEDYLRHFVRGTQKDWVKLLDVAQLCFNAQKSSSTNKSAFEIVTGQQPLLPHTLDIPQSVRSPLARSFSQEWKQNVDIAKSCLETAQKRMKKYADQNRRFVEFNAGDLVLVKVPDPRLSKSSRGRDPRLMQKYVGPLPVLRRIGTVAYKVELPPWWKIHNVFHVSQLKKYSADREDDTRNQPSRPQLELKKMKEKVAEAILDHRVTSTAKKDHTEYLVKWRGCSSEENTW